VFGEAEDALEERRFFLQIADRNGDMPEFCCCHVAPASDDLLRLF
jgi:hypothetical protein